MNRKLLLLSITGLLTLMTYGCAPRGETKTIDEVLRSARTLFMEQLRANNNPADLEAIVATFDAVLQSDQLEQTSAKSALASLATQLDGLILRAGPTTRPAMGELITQLKLLSTANQVTSPQAKLLVSRVYGLLATEMEGYKFNWK